MSSSDLELLDSLTAFVRETTQEFFSASSREDIEQIVQERFHESDLYTAGRVVESLPDVALVEHDRGGSAWTVSSKAIRLTDSTVSGDGQPVRQLPDRTDDHSGSWAFVSLEAGRTVYGGLVIHATRTDAFDERELAALEWFGDTVSQAINAVENRRLLFASAVTEIRVDCPETPLQAVAADASCRLSLESFVPSSDDRILAYCETASASADEIVTVAERVEEIAASRVVSGGSSSVAEFSITHGSPLFAFVEGMANLCAVHADEQTCTVVAEIASGTCALPTLERIREDCPDASLVAKREHNLPPSSVSSRVAPPADSLEALTDRQREVLEAAYRSGYFRWPREATAEEVAARLGVSSPTLHKHLRQAQERLLEELFDSDPATDGSRVTE